MLNCENVIQKSKFKMNSFTRNNNAQLVAAPSATTSVQYQYQIQPQQSHIIEVQQPITVTTASQQGKPAQKLAYQDDFYLLDVIGGQNISAMHPTKPIVAYTAGCMIIVYDLISDAKIQLVNHQHEVRALIFSPVGAGGSAQGGDFLISIDSNRNDAQNTATMCLWNWSRGACVQEMTLPQQQASHQLQENSAFILKFDKTGTLFTIVQSSLTSYRISVWAFSRHSSIDLIAHQDLDHQAGCLSIAMLKTKSVGPTGQAAQVYLNQGLSFMTLEKNCIKLWQFQNGSFELNKRIHIKQAISQLIVAELTGFLLILGDNGKVLILDQAGEFVSTVFKQGVFFTTIGIANDKLLLGTEKGLIHVYHLASLSFVSEIPYQFALLPKSIMNEGIVERAEEEPWNQPSNTLRVGPPVRSIELTNNLRFIKIQYADSSFVVADRSSTSKKDAVIGHHYGHFESVNDIQWIGAHPSRDHDSSYEQQQYSLVFQSNECFITVSSDLSVFVWRHFGDRWQFSYIDVAKSFDESLSFQRKTCDRSTKDLQLTAVCIYPRRRQNILISDNRGTVRVFQLGKQNATQLATFTLQRAEREKIDKLFISENEQICVVTFKSGQISIYDIKASFNWVGNVETASALSAMHAQKSIVMEKHDKFIHEQSDVYATLQSQQQGTQVKVFSVTAPNCIRVQLVDVKDGKMTKSQLVQYFIADGRISGFDLHPSKDYLLVTSNRGKIYVYRIETGELRGTINTPNHAQGCLVDPSGLYVVIQVPPFSQTQHLGTNMDLLGSNEKNLQRTTVLMYEIGTGLAASEILSVFDISQMKFSNDARYLSLGSTQGTVSVWALGDHLYSNVQQVLEASSINKDFWYNYPIFLPDAQTQVPLGPKITHVETTSTLDNYQRTSHQSNPNPYLNYLPSSQTQNRLNRLPEVQVQQIDTLPAGQLSYQKRQNKETLNQRVVKPEIIVEVDSVPNIRQASPYRSPQQRGFSPHQRGNSPQQRGVSFNLLNDQHRDQTSYMPQDISKIQSIHGVNPNSPNKAQQLYKINDSHLNYFNGKQGHKENQLPQVQQPAMSQEQQYKQYFEARSGSALKQESPRRNLDQSPCFNTKQDSPVIVERVYPNPVRQASPLHHVTGNMTGSPVVKYNQGLTNNLVGQPIKVEPYVEHLHTQYPMPQAKAPFEAFQAAQPYVEYVPGQQSVQQTYIRDINEIKRQAAPTVERPPYQIQELNYMDRSLNDRAVNTLTQNRNQDVNNANNLYRNQNFVEQLNVAKQPMEPQILQSYEVVQQKGRQAPRGTIRADPEDIDADIDQPSHLKPEQFKDVNDQGMSFTLNKMRDAETNKMDRLIGYSAKPASPARDRNRVTNNAESDKDEEQSHADDVDEAYAAINDFEVRREMQESRKQILSGAEIPRGFVHQRQQF